MFEEVIKRTRVFQDFLKENKVAHYRAITRLLNCPYYERCYIRKKEGKQISIASLFGKFGKEDKI